MEESTIIAEYPGARLLRVRHIGAARPHLEHRVLDPSMRVPATLLDTLVGTRHSSLVRYIGHTVHGGVQIITHDDVDGECMHSVVLSEREALRVATGLLLGIRVLHARGVVHKHIYHPYIYVSRARDRATLYASASGELAGSDGLARISSGFLHATAPEVLENTHTGQGFDCKCDIWSLGVTVYHAVMKRPPFGGEHLHDIVENIHTADVSFHSPEGQALTPGFKSLLTAMLEKDPLARPTAEECLDIIRTAV